MISRMELGRGGAMSLTTWTNVAEACDVDLFGTVDDDEPFGLALIRACADAGGWSILARDGPVIVLDRPPRRVRGGFRPRLLHGDRLVVTLVDVVTDIDLMIDGVRRAVAIAAGDLPEGWSCGSLVVVRWTTSNRRRLTESRASLDLVYPGSGSRWIGAIADPEATMPPGSGLLWMDVRGTRLIPMGLHLRRA